MKNLCSIIRLSGFTFLLLAGTDISNPAAASDSANNPAALNERENVGELVKGSSVTAWGRERKRISKLNAGIQKRFGVIGRKDRYDRKRLPVIKASM